MRYFIPSPLNNNPLALAYIATDDSCLEGTRHFKNGGIDVMKSSEGRIFLIGNSNFLEVSATEALAQMPEKEPELLYFIPKRHSLAKIWICATHTMTGKDMGIAYRRDGAFQEFGTVLCVKGGISIGDWKQVSKEEAIYPLSDYQREQILIIQHKIEAMKNKKVVVTATQKEEPSIRKTRYFIPNKAMSAYMEIAYCSVAPCGTKAATHYCSGRIENCLEAKNWGDWFNASSWEETTREIAMDRLQNICSLHENKIKELEAKLEQVTKERDTAVALQNRAISLCARQSKLLLEKSLESILDSILREKCPTLYLYRID